MIERATRRAMKTAIYASCLSLALACSSRSGLSTDATDASAAARDDGGASFDAGAIGDAAEPFDDASVADAATPDGGGDGFDAGPTVVAPERQYIKASNPDAHDWFGNAVALTDRWLAVGAPNESSWATGLDGDQLDDSEDDSGAVYLFESTPSGWSQRHYIKASNTGAVDGFGQVLALHGSTLVVGAPYEDSPATGIDGEQGNGDGGNHGAVYLFVEEGGTWRMEAYVKASNTDPIDLFGSSVALEGDTLVVGAPYEDSAADIDGDQADNSIENCGAVYVFERTAAGWIQAAYLKSSSPEAGDQLGASIAISGSTIVAGARGRRAEGAAYVFERTGTSWQQAALLTGSSPSPDAEFGSVVALHDDTLAVGAPAAPASDPGPELEDNGAVFVFERDDGSWNEVAHLKPSRPVERTYYGIALALYEGSLLVGATGGGSLLTPFTGSTHLYSRIEAGWIEMQQLMASNAEINDFYGSALAITAAHIVVGAIGEASDWPGIDGDSSSNNTPQAGAVYSYTR
jgi:hypothetical protein